jgi:DedD protein
MESKNLNDIVIEDSDNSKKAQLKNILTLLALLFIILVISIVITKLILGGDNENGEATQTEGNKTELVQSNSSSETSNSSSSTATAVTAAAGAALATTAVMASRSSKDDKVKEEPKPLLVERNTTSRKRPSLRDRKANEHTKRVIHRKEHKSTIAKRAYVPKKRNVTHHTKHRPVSTSNASATRGYYIKVGAFKDPTNAVKHIKAQHLRYKKVNTKGGTLTRVLVGPYYSKKDAQNDLLKVKSKIAAGAYITKIK